MLADLFMYRNLEFFTLGDILLNKIGILHRLRNILRKVQFAFVLGYKTRILEHRPGIGHHGLNVIPGFRPWVRQNDLEAIGKTPRSPTPSDNASAHQRDLFDIRLRHTLFIPR